MKYLNLMKFELQYYHINRVSGCVKEHKNIQFGLEIINSSNIPAADRLSFKQSFKCLLLCLPNISPIKLLKYIFSLN